MDCLYSCIGCWGIRELLAEDVLIRNASDQEYVSKIE